MNCGREGCICQPDKRSWKCKLGFHDYHTIGGDWICIGKNCDYIDLGVGECHGGTSIMEKKLKYGFS